MFSKGHSLSRSLRSKKCAKLRYLCSEAKFKGLVVGVFTNEQKKSSDVHFMTEEGENIASKCNGKFMEQLLIGHAIKQNETRLFWNMDEEYKAICVVGCGASKHDNRNENLEMINLDKEYTRVAAALGTSELAKRGILQIYLDGLCDVEAAAEGAVLGSYVYQQFKSKQKPLVGLNVANRSIQSDFARGCLKANAQNFARILMETPANYMTPTIFCKTVSDKLNDLDIAVKVRDLEWIQNENMGAFYSVSKGSVEPPAFLEIEYNQGKEGDKPYVLVGKGVTFDSGGISIKGGNKMDEMRADMGGAACVAGTMLAVAQMKLKVNIIGLIPLCENMPSGSATKPGDVVIARNGKSIAVDNTDAEGRLILADALCYAETFEPKAIIDIATLTGAMRVALGDAATGVFSNSNSLWKQLLEASVTSGDRVWRMPLLKRYNDVLTSKSNYDLNNIGVNAQGGGACTAAAFLYNFVPHGVDWMHLDIAGVMNSGATKYLSNDMTGRPVRTLIEFFQQIQSDC